MSGLTTIQRERIVAAGLFLYDHAHLIAYDEDRPFRVYTKAELEARFAAGETVVGDCDWFYVQTFYLAGVQDPSGFRFDGLGNTATTLAHLHGHYTDPRQARPGAIVIFGADLALAHQHGAIIIGVAADPPLLSHGQPGVKRLTLSEEQTAHTGSTVFCSPVG